MVVQRAQGLVGWGALALVLIAVLPIGGNSPITWLVLTALCLALFAVQMAIDLADKHIPPYVALLTPSAILFLGVVGWAAFQLWPAAPADWLHDAWIYVGGTEGRIAVDPSSGRHMLARLIGYAMVFWIAVRACADPKRAVTMTKVIALFSTALALYGVAVVTFGANWLTGEESDRIVTATFVNRNHYATYAAFGFLANVAALALMFEKRTAAAESARKALRSIIETIVQGGWVFAFGAAITAGALMLTVSRAGILAALAGAILFFVLQRRGEKGLRWSSPTVIIAALTATYVLVFGLAAFVSRLFDLGGDEARFSVYPKVVEAITDRPWLGYGLGGFEDGFRPYLPLDAAVGRWDYAHNVFLENTMELGLPAALALYLALGLIAWRIFLGIKNRKRYGALPAFAFAVVVTGALHSLFDFSLQMPAAAALFAFVLGLGWAQSFSSRFATAARRTAKHGDHGHVRRRLAASGAGFRGAQQPAPTHAPR
ncbi:MAG: O-antigen ligase family protein [Devosia sp.]